MEQVSAESLELLAPVDERLKRIIGLVSSLSCYLVIVASALVLLGWTFDCTILKSVSPSFVNMMPNTAVSLIIASFALLMFLSNGTGPSFLARFLGAAVFIIGAATLVEYFANLDLGIDGLLFGPSLGGAASVRMEPITAINLLCLGLALVLFKAREIRRHPLSHILAFFIAATAFLPLVGYLYQSRFLVGLGAFCAMAPQTAVSFLLLSISILFARPDHDLAAVLISNGPGGSLARKILPVAILMPLILGWIRVFAERHGLVSVEFGTALFTSINIVGFTLVIWFQGIAWQHTELHRLAMQRERDEISLQSEMRDQFVSMLSHDLRSPLTVASANAQLIQRFPEKGEFLQRNVAKILESLSRVDQMIQDLLDVNRIRAGYSIPIKVMDCDLVAIVKTTLKELSIVYGERFSFAGEELVIGTFDPLAIRRAIENLCSNAVKYGDTGHPILVRIEELKDRLRLSVANKGKRIPAAELKSVFEPFRRASTSSPKLKKGWGLGLALVKATAEAHGGKVLLESSEESGTVFTLELPKSRLGPRPFGGHEGRDLTVH